MGFKDTVHPDLLLKKQSIKCLNLCRLPESHTVNIYVSLELWSCICMEMRDSMRTLPNYSINSWKKMVGLILRTFDVFVWKIMRQMRTLFEQTFSCTTLTFLIDLGLASWRGRVWGKTLKLYGAYVIIAKFALHLISTLSLRPIVVHRVINSSKKLVTCSDNRPLANKKLQNFFQKMSINCEKKPLDKLDSFNKAYSQQEHSNIRF